MTLQGYYNRFDAADRYDELLFRAGKGLQSAELNEIQSTVVDRLKRIADAVFKDGAVISGTPPTISGANVSCLLSLIYLRGAVREVAARNFTIPTTGLVRIGVYLLDEEITELQDATLRDPALNTRNYNEPGAGRLRVTATWGREGDGGTGVFYPVYTVIDGTLLNQGGGNVGDAFSEALARYDRESNGNYIVTGLSVTALGLAAGVNAFSVKDGTGNIFGYKIDKLASTRLNYAEDPDMELVDAEPDTFTGSTGGSAAIQLNRFPVESILEVVVTKEKTVSITRGGFSGGQDTLPDVSVLSIQSITQGGTTYVANTDYFLNGDKVDWSPAGGEPAPGSTYSITYRYLGNATPSAVNLQAGTFTISGAVNGTLVLSDYRWKLPRYDRLCIDRDGNFSRIKGISSRFTALPPAVPANLLSLATIEQKWGETPVVINDGIRAIPFDQLERMRSLIVDLFDLVALERLRNDISSREPSSKRGVFVDPFLDDDLRDQGITQTAAIVDGTLQLPIAPTVYQAPTNNAQDWMLPYTEEIILEQTRQTGSSKINPYQAFDPIPAAVVLTPAVDRFTTINTVWTSPVTQQVSIFMGTTGRFSSVTSTTTRTELLSETERPAEFLRQIQVNFTLDGFDPGESLTEVKFDGIDVTPA
jgi:Domain of unknown function (DUF4815)